MSVKEYYLKFIMLSRYAPSILSNLKNEISRFVICVVDLVKEEYPTTILYIDMNLSMVMEYVELFIKIMQGNMSAEVYYLKFTMFPRYAPSLLSSPRNYISRFVIGVVDLVKEDSRTTMIHIDLNLSRVMVYAQSVEKSKLCRIIRNLKRDGSSEKNQYRFKKRAPAQDEPSAPKVKLEKGSRS